MTLPLPAVFNPALSSDRLQEVATWLLDELYATEDDLSRSTDNGYTRGCTTFGRQRSRIVAWREGLALLGVVLASVAPTMLGLPLTWVLFCACLVLGWLAWSRAVRPRARPSARPPDLWLPLRRADFRHLLGVFVLNGIAASIPATLVLFFIEDVVGRADLAPAFLVAYFAAGAAGLPLWVALCLAAARAF